MRRLLVFNYTLIEDFRNDNNDFRRTPPSLFKYHIFELIKLGFTPITIHEFLSNYYELPEGNYFLVTFNANYYANQPAIRFLLELNIPTIVFHYEADPIDNKLLYGLPLMNLHELNKILSDNPDMISIGKLPNVITENKPVDLLVTDDLNKIIDSIPTNGKYFNYLDYYHPAISRLIKIKGYSLGFSSKLGMITDPCIDRLNIPRINGTMMNQKNFDQFIKNITKNNGNGFLKNLLIKLDL